MIKKRLFLFLIAFSFHLTATALPKDTCLEALRPFWREAIHLKSIKKDSYTAYANDFMQALWDPYLNQENIENTKGIFFTKFVKQNLAELISNHQFNRKHVLQEIPVELIKADPNVEKTIAENFKSIDEYIQSLEKRISAKEDFSYVEMILFSYTLVLTRERIAHKKLFDLFRTKGLAGVQKIYPGVSRSEVERTLDNHIAEFKHPVEFWTKYYMFKHYWYEDQTETFALPQANQVMYAHSPFKNDKLQRLLFLPTTYRTGMAAFYHTYHMPISPVFLAKDFEFIDGFELASPLSNFLHDTDHYRTNLKYMVSANTLFQSLDGKDFTEDLSRLLQRVKVREDSDLLKTLHYLFYFNKFEKFSAYSTTLGQIHADLKKQNNEFNVESTIFISNLGDLMKSPYAPATDMKTFQVKMSEIISIIDEIQKEKNTP